MKSNTHKIKTIAVLWFRLYLHVKLEKQLCLTELKRCSSLPAARWERERERERERCARAEQSRHREREREVCARAGRARPCARATVRWFSETRFGCFFEGKKVAKGVCNVAKLATLCISISPTTGWATGQTGNTRCVKKNECR